MGLGSLRFEKEIESQPETALRKLGWCVFSASD